MPGVMFKLRVSNPFKRHSAAWNKSHLEYIGRRPGVTLNDGMKHGLFGKINGVKCEETENIYDMSRQISKATRKGAIVYKTIVSLAETDAEKLGYDDVEKWQDLVKQKLPDICVKLGISMKNLNYAAAVHPEAGHPHVHIMFWEKAQKVKKQAFVHPKTANDIRVDLTKHVFAEEMRDLHLIKNAARSAAVNNLSGTLSDIADKFMKMSPKDYEEAAERLKLDGELANSRLIHNRFKTSDIREIAADLLKISEKIPKTGRVAMKFMPPDVKTDVHELIKKILAKNIHCRNEFEKYLNAAEALAKYFSNDPVKHAKARKNAENTVFNTLSNSVLKAAKKLNQIERDNKFEAQRQLRQRVATENIVREFFAVLSGLSEREQNKLSYAVRTGELSKQAKKELAIQFENSSGYDWEI